MDRLISLQAAIDAPVKMVSEGIEWIPVYHIKGLPSAQPEPLKITIDHTPTADEMERIKQAMRITPVIVFPSAQPEPSEITDEQAIMHLQSTGWMQNHDREMYESGLRERLADDSDSYDALLPSAQPEIIACGDCKHWIWHDRRCGYWNHGVKPLEWCCHAERRTDESD